MDHVAIMKREWKLLDKIISGEKTIESRWYTAKHAPWDAVHAGDVVYFKDTGSPVTAKAEVADVLQLEANAQGIKELVERYAQEIGMEKGTLYALVKDKRYCILIFLKNPQRIAPFEIDKKGFGNMAAWLCVEDIAKVRL